MKKRLLTGLLAIGMTMTLAACGSEAATQEAATEAAAETTEADTETTEAAEDVTLNYGFYTTEDATTEDGRTYEKVLVDEKTTYGYYFNEDLESGILIGTDGTVYDALALDESVARDLVKTTITGQ